MIAVELSFTPHERRLAARPAHRSILQRLHSDGRLLAAGPWADDSGALLLFDLDRSAVDSLLADDPYYTTTGVTVVSVREWLPVVGPSRPGTESD
jgi:uncharacterized protein YciI